MPRRPRFRKRMAKKSVKPRSAVDQKQQKQINRLKSIVIPNTTRYTDHVDAGIAVRSESDILLSVHDLLGTITPGSDKINQRIGQEIKLRRHSFAYKVTNSAGANRLLRFILMWSHNALTLSDLAEIFHQFAVGAAPNIYARRKPVYKGLDVLVDRLHVIGGVGADDRPNIFLMKGVVNLKNHVVQWDEAGAVNNGYLYSLWMTDGASTDITYTGYSRTSYYA